MARENDTAVGKISSALKAFGESVLMRKRHFTAIRHCIIL